MRLGIKGPKSFPYNLNSRIDILLKNEFDKARTEKTFYQKEANIDYSLFSPELEIWREPFKAARFHHKTNITVAGSVDDLWQDINTKNSYCGL